MRPRIVDLETVRDVRQRLGEPARAHPEAFDPERLPITPGAVARAMQPPRRTGRPPAADPTILVPARLQRSVVEAIDELVAERRRTDPAATRQDVLRDAVSRYLAAEKKARTPQ